MERRFSHRESVLLGYIPQKSLTNHSSSSPKIPQGNSDVDVDFKDVFGGPPRRRSSIQQEMRFSFGETTDSSANTGDDGTISGRSRWSGLSDKPVFGEDGVNRRRYPSHDFFDDIFRGNDPLSSSPRKHDWDPFSSSPGSRVLSPARPLPPKAEPFGTSQFSLPAKLTNGMDLPAFGAANRSQYKNKDGASNGMSYYSHSPLARSSSYRNKELRNDGQLPYCQSALSRELFLSSEESSYLTKADTTETEDNSKKGSESIEVSTDSSQFHFSIHKWASKGLPLVMPLRGGNGSRLKEKCKTERCLSSNGRMESQNMAREFPTATLLDTNLSSFDDKISKNTESLCMEQDKQEHDSLPDTSPQDGVEPHHLVEEATLPKPESEILSSLHTTAKDNPGDTISLNSREQTKHHSSSEKDSCEKTEKEMCVFTKEVDKPESKTLHSLLLYSNDDEQGNDEVNRKASRKDSMVKSTKKSSRIVDFSKNIMQQDGKGSTFDNAKVGRASSRGSPMKSGDLGKDRIKGKVKEFIKIFNQESSSKPKIDVENQHQSSRLKERGTYRVENEAHVGTTKIYKKMHNVHKTKTSPDAPVVVGEYFKQSMKQQSSIRSTNYVSNDTSPGQKDRSASSVVSIPNGSKVIVGDADESLQVNFLVKELTQDNNKLTQTGNGHKEIQVIDAQVRQWSSGKEGNIRSLLSTLQYVLWSESGWKPVPLVDIIEGNAVKRTYQKALLCLHPDKLQQKGASSHQKYIAEKVFDILQEAWTHFNSLGSV